MFVRMLYCSKENHNEGYNNEGDHFLSGKGGGGEAGLRSLARIFSPVLAGNQVGLPEHYRILGNPVGWGLQPPPLLTASCACGGRVLKATLLNSFLH